jgi:hypothetical protein
LAGRGGGAIVGFTGRMIGGGLGTGLFGLAAAGVTFDSRLCDSGMRSTTVARLDFCCGKGMIPSVSKASRRAPLTARASAKPDARRRSGGRENAEGSR